MTGKQRAYLRSIANTLTPAFQIGKEGISDSQLTSLGEYLTAHELVKISLHETAPLTARESCDRVARELGAEPVQCIGRKIVLYRESSEQKRIELP